MRRHLTALAVAAAIVPGLTACGGDDGTTLTVYAASSLKPAFEELAERFEAEHDGVEVELSFAGSSDLVSQIQQGAPADVFASADTRNMDKLVADDLLGGDPRPFASNTLAIAVPPGNPAGVHSLADLARDAVNLVLCAPEVPCGAAARDVERAAGLDFSPVSEEQNVTDVLNKVLAAEADAGLVYVTDVIAAGDRVERIDFPEAAGAVNVYPIATIAGAEEPDLGRRFVDLVVGAAGQDVLADAGFGRP